ncbi:hypothetical protein HZS55_09185 [Halosimplex rubrum]|uniref:Phage major capsid protein n=1 Tax=Halosimplex rubrum TaxID=869889 RepID=A0A7D5P4Q5_9EURY|nr:hypothetical protein [Halosimplex rubrum]QLH77458.1 hypothetical protein HZS55_09185 [Halosimplex rubrum]
MGITASDVVSDDDVRAIVEEIRNQYYQARRPFREHDATDINSNSFDFPVSNSDIDGEAVEIPEGADYPRAEKDYSEVSAAYTKYGVEVTISDEAVDDGYIDVEMDAEEDMVRAEEKRMDTVAFGVLSGNTNSAGPIDANSNSNNTIEYADIVQARQQAFTDELSLSDTVLVAAGQNMADFLNMDEFTQASELGDQVITQGVLPGGNLVGTEALLGVVGDVPVYLSNSGSFSQGQAFMVDTSNFGWESVRWDTEIDQYREDSNDQDVWKIRGRWDWVATQPSANIEINT